MAVIGPSSQAQAALLAPKSPTVIALSSPGAISQHTKGRHGASNSGPISRRALFQETETYRTLHGCHTCGQISLYGRRYNRSSSSSTATCAPVKEIETCNELSSDHNLTFKDKHGRGVSTGQMKDNRRLGRRSSRICIILAWAATNEC